MNPNDPVETNRTSIEDAKTQCCLYLLGELVGSDREYFESQLSNSTELADELVRQADLILAVADSPMASELTVTVPITRSSPTKRRSLLTAALAMAACLALLVVGIQQNDRGPVEELLIARAWADNIAVVSAGPIFPESGDAESGETDSDQDGAGVADSFAVDSSDYASFDWMFTAVSESSHGG